MTKRTCIHAKHRFECVSCQYERDRANAHDLATLLDTALVIGWGVLMVLAAVALS